LFSFGGLHESNPNPTQAMMKKLLLALTFAAYGALNLLHAQSVPNYQWDFNVANAASGTNIVPSAIPGNDSQAFLTQEAILQMANSAGTATGLLGLPGSGVGTNANDRAVLLAGTMGGSGPIVRTPALPNTLTNLGYITNFTITAWVKADSAFSGFPRIFEMGGQNVDNSGLNSLGLLFFTGNTLQLKVHGLGANGISGPAGLLNGGLTDWIFVAVTYDATLDSTVTNNVYFYNGDRFNTLGAGTGGMYGPGNGSGTSVNSVFPASPNGPGYVNFSGGTNGDGSFSTVSNQVWVYIGNRSSRDRAFNGRYDDIRFYANTPNGPLGQTDLDQVRLSPGLSLPGPLTVTQQPQNTTVIEGQGAAFTVQTTPAPNLSYQWFVRSHGTGATNLIAGATNQILEIPNVIVAGNDGDTYRVVIASTDPHAGSTNSLFAKLTVVPPASLVATPGMLKFEYFANAGNGTTVSGFLNAPTANYSNNTPDLTTYMSSFNTRNVFPDDSHQGYFARVSGFITPTITTNYVFYIAASDQAQLYLSTDGGASSNLVCEDAVTGAQVLTGPESTPSFPGGRFSSPMPLTAGVSYPVTAFLKSSAGANFMNVAWKTDSGLQDLPVDDQQIADRLPTIPAAVLSTLAPPSGTVSITSPLQPITPSVAANSQVTFTVGISPSLSTNNASTANGPVVVQWQKNGGNILGATGTHYTTPYLSLADNNAQFSAVVSAPGVSNQTTTATVTVTADNVKPTVVNAAADDSGYGVHVQFSEPVNAATALNPANYSIPGTTVVGASFLSDSNLVDNPTHDAVKLITTNVLADNATYTLTVNNVTDTAAVPNTIGAPGNTATFRPMGLYPGVVKFEYFESQNYLAISGLDVNGLVTLSPKFTNNDPDTVVFPTLAEMSPDGSTVIRSSQGGNLNAFPPFYGTRMSMIFVPPVTTNYVFYIAPDDSGILWLSTDENPANKHPIAYVAAAVGKRAWSGSPNGSTATFPTNYIGPVVTAPNASPWPTADANGFATITLTAGQRYYLEEDHMENAGFTSFDAVTYVMAADNATVTPPVDGSDPALTGSVIGWRLPLPQFTSVSTGNGTVSLAWTNNFSRVNLGAFGYPGLGNITAAFPSNALLTASAVGGPYTILTNTSPATLPATSPAQFFRIGE
jgi:hypothetical protein